MPSITRRTALTSLAGGAAAASALSWGGARAAAPRRGGTMRMLVHPEPPHLILALSQASGTYTIATKIFESLLRYDFALKPQPSLARSWEISPDGLVYTFHLQRGVKWHDGTPFTAADVIFTTQDLLMKTHPRARSVFSRVATAEAPDALTVRYTLKEPYSPFIYALEASGCPIMPKHLYEGTDYANNPHNAKPIGTGPFRFVEWRRGEYVQLERNPEYWEDPLPYLDAIRIQFIPDASARTLAIEQGLVDIAGMDAPPFSDVERFKKNPNLVLHANGGEFASPHVIMDLNNRVGPFQDKRFRKAMIHAVNRNFIRDQIFYGQGKVPTGPIASTTTYYSADVPTYDYNPRKATALLDEMGLKPDSRGVRARVKIMPMPYGDSWMRLAEYTRESLRQIGVAASMESVDPSGYVQRYTNWDFEITYSALYQFADPALGVARTYLCSNIRKVFLANANGYCNEQIDKMWGEATAAVDEKKRQSIYDEIQKVLVDDVPIVPLLELRYPLVTRAALKDAVVMSTGCNDSMRAAYFA